MASSTTGKNSNLTNDLFDAVYTIVTGVVAQQDYDITKECRVIEVYLDDKGARTGIYKVKSQDAVYDAYARQGEVYSVGQNVYVQIPNGDFNNQKFIIGLKINPEDEQDIYNLKLPFDDFIGFYNLTYYTPMVSTGYWANCDYHGGSTDQVATGAFPMSEDHVWHWENVDHRPIVASKLGVEVDVTTLLHTFRPIAGKYGFRIIVRGLYSENEQTDAREETVKEYYFTNDNMYGNPYAYTMPSTQQIVIDTTGFKSYESIDIWFWQDHKFLDELGKIIPWGGQSEEEKKDLRDYYMGKIKEIADNDALDEKDKNGQINALMAEYSDKMSQNAELKNILFDNMHVLLGLSLAEANEETVTIYTYDTTVYGEDPNNAATREEYRTLYAAWVHKVDDTLELIDTYNRTQELEAKVYWYNYDPEWAPENPDYDADNPAHRFGGNYWRPYPYVDDVKYEVNTPISFQVKPDRNKSKDRYKCVIHYNNTYVISNVFIFQNFNSSIESDNANLARNDRIILRCATLQPSGYTIYDKYGKQVGTSSENIAPGKGKYFKNLAGNMELLTELHTIKPNDFETLVPDDAVGNFFVYNENNSVLANDKNILFSDVQYFIEPWIRVDNHIASDYVITDESTYVRLTEYTNADGVKPNFNITWQFPESFTMIRSWGLLNDEARDIQYWNNRSDQLFELDKKATRYFYIDAIHNVRYNDNEISATIDIEGMGTFNIKKDLLFGRAGAFGCEFNPVITISEPAGNFYVDTAGEFEIRCLVYDRSGGLMPLEDRAQCKFTWRYIGTNAKPKDDREHLSYEGFSGNVIRGRVTQPIPFVIEVTVSNAAEYDITVRRGIMVSNNTNFMQSHDIVVPSRIEFRSDGQAPIFASNVFEVQKIRGDVVGKNDVDAQNELIYPEWKINQTKVLYLVERENEYPIFTLPDGTVQTKDPYTTYALGFSATQLNTNVAVEKAYAQQWTEDLLTDDYFTYIYFDYEGATVAQAIAFAQNLYPSSLVNEWDGQSLSLDYENSAIIAKMIAAGTKDQRNRFTGVMMGDWHEKADESLDTPGLYGFNAGQQSFGFKTDGTGFIGPSGEGRIQFDGRNALISNSTYTNYINLNPRRIEDYLSEDESGKYVIDNQAWNSIGNQSISQYFLYSQAPRRITTFGTESPLAWNEIQMQYWDQNPDLTWVKPFFEDESHDYFLVDPSYGVVTTGGIFARYGRIGKNHPWIISDYGLTQKNNFGKIFLGDPEKNLSLGTYIPNPTFTFNGLEVTSYVKTFDDGTTVLVTIPENFFTISVANDNNVIQTGIRSDGYFYTKYATIANWYINEYEIYATDREYGSGGMAQGYRKVYDNYLKDGLPTGFRKDFINLNSKEQFLSFNKGHMIINGKDGWMGVYNGGEGIDLKNVPTYNLFIDFIGGNVAFDKRSKEDIPNTVISGTSGEAYFSKGNIYFDGKTATIFCGLQEKRYFPFENSTGGVEIALESVTTGRLYLAAMKLEGTTIGSFTQGFDGARQVATKVKNTDTNDAGSILEFDLGGYDDVTYTDIVEDSGGGDSGGGDSGGGGGVANLTPFESSYFETSSSKIIDAVTSFTINGLFSLSLDDSQNPENSGASGNGLYIAIADQGVVLAPTANDGYLVGNWHLDIQDLVVQKNAIVKGDLIGNAIYMGPETAPLLVATQEWVNSILVKDVWPKIKTVNNAAAAAMKKAQEALKKAIKGINLANQALKKIKDMAQKIEDSAVTNIKLETIGISGGFKGIKAIGYNAAGKQVTESDGGGAAFAEIHRHDLTLSYENGTLRGKIGAVTAAGSQTDGLITIFDGNSALSFTPDGGQITCSITIAGKNATKSFNIADTQYYMDGLDVSASTPTYNGNNKTITVKNKNGDSITISAVSAYNAGWAAAVAKYSTSWSGNVITIKGPAAFVDTAAEDVKYTITAGASCSVTASESSITYTSNGTHDRTASASGTAYGYAYINGTKVASKTDTDSDSDSYTVTVNVSTSTT